MKTAKDNYESLFRSVIADARYRTNLDWGRPRRGHPEGSVRAHIQELELNLNALRDSLVDDDYWKLRVLVHVHDSFKAEAAKGVAINDPRSHASLAATFLKSFCDLDQPEHIDLVQMVQLHDEPYALWRRAKLGKSPNVHRLNSLFEAIGNWRLFLTFLAIDGVTRGKDTTPLRWSAEKLASRFDLQEYAESCIERLESDLECR